MAEFYKKVPKELRANLEYRIALRKRAERDVGFQEAVKAACKQDVLFFFNAMCWVYEPRPQIINGVEQSRQRPFITWPHQDPAIKTIDEFLGFEDIGAEKSRGEGMSWIAILFACRDWLFKPMTSIGLVSKSEGSVDNPMDSDSLMWKLDWELTKLPHWMSGNKDVDYKRNVSDHTLYNVRNGSMITGYAATGDVASGGRKAWFLMDELAKFPRGPDADAMASTQYVTNSRLVVSTPKGADGEYYRIMHEPSSMVKIVLDWKENPTRNRGLYRFDGSTPVAVDPVNNPLPKDYSPPTPQVLDLFSRLRRRGFKLDGVDRSPWLDHECDRPGATPQNVAQELGRDYGGSMHRIFGHGFQAAAAERIREPNLRGVLDYNTETLEPSFDTSDDGPILLWTSLDVHNRPPPHLYVVSADIGAGLGGSFTSNSVAEVIDLVTMEQVLEYATNTTEPSDFADECIAIAKWFHGAYLAWEANGPGGAFTKRVVQREYPHVFKRPLLWKRGRKKTKELGWWTDPKSKEVLFTEISNSISTREVTIHSKALAAEFGQYIRKNGDIEHVLVGKTDDDSSKGKAHGDRVIAFGVGLQALRDRPLPSKSLETFLDSNPPPCSMAARLKEYEESQQSDQLWDDRDSAALASSGRAAGRLGLRRAA